MKNSSIVKAILDITEKEHLNLYHSITKEEILSHIKSINWDNLTSLQFDLEMLKLFSKFKDAHTSYFIPTIDTNKKFILNNNEIYLKNEEKYEKIHILMDIYTEFAAKASKYKNPINDVGVTKVYGIDHIENVIGDLRINFKKEHSLTPMRLVDELKLFDRVFFKLMFTGSIYRKIYRLYEFYS